MDLDTVHNQIWMVGKLVTMKTMRDSVGLFGSGHVYTASVRFLSQTFMNVVQCKVPISLHQTFNSKHCMRRLPTSK